MSKQPMPILGEPIFLIARENMSERIQIASDGGYLNELTYFAVNAIMVVGLEYVDEKMDKVIINKGMKESKEPDAKSLQFTYDLNKEPENAYDLFVNEDLAQKIAERMNKTQKAVAKKMSDEILKCLHEYDNVIALCTVKPGKK